MDPFSLKTILLAKHAQHVVLIHFPIALFLAGTAFDVGAHWTGNRGTAAAARYNLIAAAIATPAVLVTGFLAWYWALDAPRFKGILLVHLATGCAAGVMMIAAGLIHWRGAPENRLAAMYRLPFELLAAALVLITAHLGGFLSGVNLPG